MDCPDPWYKIAIEEAFCTFLRFKENVMLVEMMSGGSSHRFHPSSPYLAVSVPARSGRSR